MEQSFSESDMPLSPLLERLQVLRQLQLMQRGKLQKQRIQFQESSETTSSITEIVSHFSNSPSYRTFSSLLHSPRTISSVSNETSPRLFDSESLHKVKEKDLIEGVSMLDSSRQADCVANSPTSIIKSQKFVVESEKDENKKLSIHSASTSQSLGKQISLDEMPISSPKQDFESLIEEKLQNEEHPKKHNIPTNIHVSQIKKPFLKRGEGLVRFGLKKDKPMIQNTKSLPWRKKPLDHNLNAYCSPLKKIKANCKRLSPAQVKILEQEPNVPAPRNVEITRHNSPPEKTSLNRQKKLISHQEQQNQESHKVQALPIDIDDTKSADCKVHHVEAVKVDKQKRISPSIERHQLLKNKGGTWASVLTKEQNDFLRKLKQSDYYKNFVSPAKSIISDSSCNENLNRLTQARENAEQNMFELLESKVTHESFNLNNSFFNRFIKSSLECSGESTPLIMQKCLNNNPNLMHIFPELNHGQENVNTHSYAETCSSCTTECCNDTCSSISTCCECKNQMTNSNQSSFKTKELQNDDATKKGANKTNTKQVLNDLADNHNDTVIDDNALLKANITEMNAKLVATSELLKDRLQELEDEIETFRKENINLSKMREEIDLEKQKFYEDKSSYEQKLNEDKILSEYYLAEEKEKLNKQKQMYERYVREIRGRLNKKDKDEVLNLKKEINDLKEEIRVKDAKFTSTIARLRNQIKILEKDKKDLLEDRDKLKKENKRIQHSNDITRRLSNLKYLEEINKKLTNMSSKETKSEVHVDKDIKYKSYEIERQSRSRKKQSLTKNTVKPRAKSVPNLNVTSRYAKYFSQKNIVSARDNINSDNLHSPYDNDVTENHYDNRNDILSSDDSKSIGESNDSENENHLEKIYMERFNTSSPQSSKSVVVSNSIVEKAKTNDDGFFISQSFSKHTKSQSPNPSPFTHGASNSNCGKSKSPVSILSQRSHSEKSDRTSNTNMSQAGQIFEYQNRLGSNITNKTPISMLHNHNINMTSERYEANLAVSPEPSDSACLSKTNLNPTEICKPDGSKELRFPNGNKKYISSNGQYTKFVYYNGDIKENFLNEGRIKYFYAETKTYHTTHADGLEVIEFPDGQVEKQYKDGSSEIRLPNGSIRYFDPKNEHIREEWRFPDGSMLTVSDTGEQRIVFSNGQVEVHTKDHKRREFPDGTVKLVYNDGTSETRYSTGRVRIKDKHGYLIMDSASK